MKAFKQFNNIGGQENCNQLIDLIVSKDASIFSELVSETMKEREINHKKIIEKNNEIEKTIKIQTKEPENQERDFLTVKNSLGAFNVTHVMMIKEIIEEILKKNPSNNTLIKNISWGFNPDLTPDFLSFSIDGKSLDEKQEHLVETLTQLMIEESKLIFTSIARTSGNFFSDLNDNLEQQEEESQEHKYLSFKEIEGQIPQIISLDKKHFIYYEKLSVLDNASINQSTLRCVKRKKRRCS